MLESITAQLEGMTDGALLCLSETTVDVNILRCIVQEYSIRMAIREVVWTTR